MNNEPLTREQHKALIDAANLICEHVLNRIKPGWMIRLEMDSQEATLELFDEDGNEVEDIDSESGVSQIDRLCGESWEVNEVPDDVHGCVPVLRPGDAVKVNGFLGVVSKSQVVVDGHCCEWHSVRPMKEHANMPTYAIEWKSSCGLRNAWWQRKELEVVSLGPFH